MRRVCSCEGVIVAKNNLPLPVERIEQSILLIRGQRVMLDADLAALVLNRAVRRNLDRFPTDLMFQLIPSEFDDLSSQFVTSSARHVIPAKAGIQEGAGPLLSQG